MTSPVPIQTVHSAQNLDKNELYSIGPDFWHVRGRFIFLKVIDTGTQMSIIRLPNGKFVVIDTVEMDDHLRDQINRLTNNGEDIEAVLGTHAFHTLSFPAFYRQYPKAAYYGTPRHVHLLTEIPWKGDLSDCQVRKRWEPTIEMRIPAGLDINLVSVSNRIDCRSDFRS